LVTDRECFLLTTSLQSTYSRSVAVHSSHIRFVQLFLLPTPAVQPPAWVRRSVASVCLSVCLYVHALKGKRLELSTPNLEHIYSIAVVQHALTQRSKGQRSRSHGYKNHHGRTFASDACCCLPPCAAAAAGVGLHVDMTACVILCITSTLVPVML